MLYNSYNIVTPCQFVQPVQPVQLRLQILYKMFTQRLYNFNYNFIYWLYNSMYNKLQNILQNLVQYVSKVCTNLLFNISYRLYNVSDKIVQIVTLYISYNV